MPSLKEQPKTLKPYLFHGLELSWKEGDSDAIGDCPFCGKEGKFAVSIEKGTARCWTCEVNPEAKGGGVNHLSFVRKLWEMAQYPSGSPEEKELSANRKLAHPDTLSLWGAVLSPITGEWLLPGYDAKGEICNLYRYTKSLTGKRVLLATPELHHGLFGVAQYDPKKPEVYLAEGPWDGMVLAEALLVSKEQEDGTLRATSNPNNSLLSKTNVLAVPGCMTFQDAWVGYFSGKRVVLCYDNDHPRQNPNSDKITPPAAYTGLKRAVGVLMGCHKPPESISYLKWGEDGFDPDKPHGYDMRDLLTQGKDLAGRIPFLQELLDKIEEAPKEWTVDSHTSKATALGPLECNDLATLRLAWRKAMTWTDDLDYCLTCMLACCTSTRAAGQDQLWLQVIGPPSSGKTTLSEALGTAREYTFPKDTFSGLTSGYQVDAEGSENMSLVDRLKDKTLIINDGDTLLQLTNRDKVLSQMRAFYGRNLRTSYGNKMSKDHEGINTTIILCGTSSLRQLDSSELGERFIRVQIVEDLDEELEDSVGWKIANRADREMAYEANGTMDSMEPPEMVQAKRLTGGYLTYLRQHSQKLLEKVYASEQALRKCQRLAKFIAYTRARPSSKQEEKVERELSYRLIAQLVRLAKCLAVVLQKTEVDTDVMQRVHKAAMDTARGRTLSIIQVLYKGGMIMGVTTDELAHQTMCNPDGERRFLHFLRKLGAVHHFKRPVEGSHYKGKPAWRLTEPMQQLYEEVCR